MNVYTCELCGEGTRDYDVVYTPFYFAVLPGFDNDAWGKHSNEAKVCDRHLEEYEWPVWQQARTTRMDDRYSPRAQLERDVIARCDQRRIPEGAKPDYFFAR